MSYARPLDSNWLGGLNRAVRERFGHLLHELAKFGVVGAVAYLVDLTTFNALRSGALSDKPLTAKLISTVVATTVAYFGNRQWTFRHRERQGMRKEYLLFFGFNAVGLAIALGCLGTSHYLLDLTSPLADNVSANVIGMAFGTIFRFWAYRRWVFLETDDPVAETVLV
ncbi:MAG TPA: GtrA family protein [Sporichthyaceae bacterium]|nr:GtrA family protein [Sporichthyaceae bacterium]